MRFEIGKTYRFGLGSGKTMRIVGTITHSLTWQNALVGEEEDGRLVPIGTDDISAMGWEEIEGEVPRVADVEEPAEANDGGGSPAD